MFDLENQWQQPLPEPAGLTDAVSCLIDSPESEESEFLLFLYLPLLSTKNIQLLIRVSDHTSFFVREAFAEAIIKNPESALLTVAESLSQDMRSQVAGPGKKTLGAVKRIRYEQGVS